MSHFGHGIVQCSTTLISTQDLFKQNSWQTPVAAITVYSAPEDGRKGRPKHVSILVVFNKYNTARVASCWFIIYYILYYFYYTNYSMQIIFSTLQRCLTQTRKRRFWRSEWNVVIIKWLSSTKFLFVVSVNCPKHSSIYTVRIFTGISYIIIVGSTQTLTETSTKNTFCGVRA